MSAWLSRNAAAARRDEEVEDAEPERGEDPRREALRSIETRREVSVELRQAPHRAVREVRHLRALDGLEGTVVEHGPERRGEELACEGACHDLQRGQPRRIGIGSPCHTLVSGYDSTAKRTAVRSSSCSSSFTNDGTVRRPRPSAWMYALWRWP